MREALSNSIAPTPAARHRFHLLDGLRGVAAILVVYWHAPSYLWSQNGHANYLAVDFFFCLSGFVVSFAYERRLRESLTFPRFVAARLIRLYPTYLLALLIGIPVFLFILVPHPIPPGLSRHIALLVPMQIVMLPNLGVYPDILLFPVLNPGWSLFFELLANIAFGVLVVMRRASWVYIFPVYLIALLSMIYWSHFHFTVDVGFESSLKSVSAGIARVSLSFTAGILVRRLYERLQHRILTPSVSGWVALALAATLLVALLTPFGFMRTQPYLLGLMAVGFPLLVLIGALCRPSSGWTPLCAFLGDISYPVYLLHYPILMLLITTPVHAFLAPYAAARNWIMGFTILVIAGLAYAAVRFYETPLRKQLTRRLNAAPAPTSHSQPRNAVTTRYS